MEKRMKVKLKVKDIPNTFQKIYFKVAVAEFSKMM